MSQGRRTRVHLGASGYRSVVEVGAHRLVADEPIDVGGTDTGPTPVELVGAALGSCIAITVRMVAERKGWPLEGMDVQVERRQVPVEGGRPRIRFEVAVALVGPLDEAMRAELGRIAGRCPVHRMLESGAEVVTKVVG